MRPAFLMGHSIGELAAAHVAEVFSLQDACVLVAARGRLMGALPEGGATVSLQSSEQEVLEAIEGFDGRVSLAAVNGPYSVVVSGDEAAVLDLAGVWQERGRKAKRLLVAHAFHSAWMDGMLEEFANVAHGLSFSPPQIPIVSNLSGEPVSAERICSAGYWVEHVRRPVRFLDGMRWLGAQGVRNFLELGPDGVLSAMSQDCFEGEQGFEDNDAVGGGGTGDAAAESVVAVPALRAERPEAESLLRAVGEVWAHGVACELGCALSWFGYQAGEAACLCVSA